MVRSIHRPVILSVDDDENAHILLKHAFAKAGCAGSLLCLDGGAALIDYLSGAEPFSDRTTFPRPDLLLLDLKMPLISGFDVLMLLRDQPHLRVCPVVVFSSSGNQDDINKAVALGCDNYMIKPTSFEKLIECAKTLHHHCIAALSATRLEVAASVAVAPH